jgi:hypothetical protein
MSLINDALRRAKAAQQQMPSSTHTELRFRPVDCSTVPRRSNARWYILGLFVLLLGAGFIAFRYLDGRNLLKSSSPQTVQARSTVDPAIEPQPLGAPASRRQPIEKSPVQNQNKIASSPMVPPPSVPAVSEPPKGQTNQRDETAAIASAPVPPKPAEPRLQAIFFSPPNPSAMINGKTFFVGDKIGEFKLAAVDQQTATLVGAGKTNVLALP